MDTGYVVPMRIAVLERLDFDSIDKGVGTEGTLSHRTGSSVVYSLCCREETMATRWWRLADGDALMESQLRQCCIQ